jgi:uncharacterized membrane protein YraQ (UPF0718 family)/copper chaperone CopZ
MAFYLLIGFLFAGILHIYIRKERVGRYLGGNNLKSVANASLFGVPLPLCSCGVIPAGLSFYKNGASKGSTVSFLISTPQTGIDSIMVTYSLLGLPFAIVRPIVAFLTGLFGGAIANKANGPDHADQVHKSDERLKHLSPLAKMKEAVYYGYVEFLQDISKWLILGLLIAAALAVIIPDDFFTTYIEYKWLNILIVLAASVPIYVCATGSVPIAAVLLMKGLSPGAALVFLMAGPATNVATIAVLAKTLGRKTTIIYLATIIGGAVLSGLFIDAFLPAKWFLSTLTHTGHAHFLPGWLQIGSSIILSILLLNGIILKWRREQKEKNKTLITEGMEVKTFLVEGMSCKNCKAHVERDVQGVEGVDDVQVNLATGEVTVTGDNISEEKIKSSVEAGGYSFKGKI